MQVQLKVNGKSSTLDLPENTLLVQALREHLKLTGTHVGCDTAQCGACTVIVNGHAVRVAAHAHHAKQNELFELAEHRISI